MRRADHVATAAIRPVDRLHECGRANLSPQLVAVPTSFIFQQRCLGAGSASTGLDLIFFDFYINALNDAAAAAGGKRGSSSSPGSRHCSGAQTDQRGDYSGSSACPVAGLASLANTNPPLGRAVWRSCAWRAARGGACPWFASDNADGNSADTQPCQIRKTTRGTAGYTAGTASKAGDHQSMSPFLCSAPARTACHC